MKALVRKPEETETREEISSVLNNRCAGKNCGRALRENESFREISFTSPDEVIISPRVRKKMDNEKFRFCTRCFRQIYSLIRWQYVHAEQKKQAV